MGVFIISVLYILNGIIMLAVAGIGGVVLSIDSGDFSTDIPDEMFEERNMSSDEIEAVRMLADILEYLVPVLVAVGMFSFVVAFGLLTGKRWSWKIAVIFSIIAIIVGLIDIISAVINLVILYYLYRPHVKKYFKRDAEIL